MKCGHIFYCTQCNNVYWSQSLKDKYSGASQFEACQKLQNEGLASIAASLPTCSCGGQFKPGANPKCPHCHHEFKHQDNPIERLADPHVILQNQACLYFDDANNHYQVKIELSRIKMLVSKIIAKLKFRTDKPPSKTK